MRGSINTARRLLTEGHACMAPSGVPGLRRRDERGRGGWLEPGSRGRRRLQLPQPAEDRAGRRLLTDCERGLRDAGSPLAALLDAASGTLAGDEGWDLSLLHHKLYLTNPRVCPCPTAS